MRKWKRFDQRGITIMELTIAVVFIGILALIASTRILHAKERAHVGQAQQEVASLQKALALYAADFDRYPDMIHSLDELLRALQDPQGNSYIEYLGGESYRFVSYELFTENEYILRVEATNRAHTPIRVTPDGIAVLE